MIQLQLVHQGQDNTCYLPDVVLVLRHAPKIAAIGNGLYACSRTGASLLEQYRRLQAVCTHEKRDPRGTCYRCGHRQAVAGRGDRS
jgi:hypothetical protein